MSLTKHLGASDANLTNKLPTVRKNWIVEIVFFDHAEGDESFEFVAFGRVVWQTKKDLTIACWTYTDPSHKVKLDDYNVHLYTIVKSAIKSVRQLCYQSS